MEMNYCMHCGTRLQLKEHPEGGLVPYCESCSAFRHPVFSTAVSMIVMNPERTKMILIRQYGRPHYIFVHYWAIWSSIGLTDVRFWYEWRHHLQQEWDLWYGCWKNENNRKKPRVVIIKALREDVYGLGYHFAPFIYNAIKAGDQSLEQHFSALWPEDKTNETFVVWWEREKDKYTLPFCEGYRVAKGRLKGRARLLSSPKRNHHS